MQRFSVKKWWSVVGSDKGVFVYYDEAQAMIDRLRADRDRHRNDNKALWERIAQQQKAFIETSNLCASIYAESQLIDERLINDILYEVREIVEHKVSYELADEIEAKVKAIYGVE